ncbi:arabinogalactan endo-beta-1,4-galactanase [Salinimicrobium marinum]|uniref:Arabinogalactan endo-beta-1,4-galactanase n=1 Tax=Salinimicrobium marinum TaxID=680283 RepID=A0A918VWC5_9FLAO|nr:glycosyl hydrolase 53 family protein [Salinimicrobium marinum]GHA29433.1 arabinogalactan endo-beta-1,4-galactanase [Salinimicrobium marinum]
MKRLSFIVCLFALLIFSVSGCREDDAEVIDTPEVPVDPDDEEDDTEISVTYFGADLSYVNEMEDCGGVYNNAAGEEADPFVLFKEAGANLVRVRLWHDPQWTNYSDFEDVRKTIERAKLQNMEVLLDFHYSDTWADPENQVIPEAWNHIEDTEILADSLYNYTYSTLFRLLEEDLLPEIVQVGNEINSEILAPGVATWPINWERNIQLINSGLKAVDDFSGDHNIEIETMLHIAQPENALWWFEAAEENGLKAYDWIGISYYPVWSNYGLEEVSGAVQELKQTYGKRVMVVETAYPHTLEDADSANNNIGQNALIPDYEASPEGQRQYLIDLVKKLDEGGAEGLIYWEPAWISTNCNTLWGQGSHWDNATFFDAETSKALPAFDFFDRNNY